MQFRKRYNRCLLISVGLLAVLTIIIAVLIMVFVGVRAYPPTVGKQICLTYRSVVNIDLLVTF